MAHSFIPVEIRFWKYVVRPDDPDACWEWTGAAQKEGYGVLRGTPPDTRNVTASHVSYRIHVGPIPEDHKVLHRCDNPPCCNPKHLFTGTHKDNMEDCARKGRTLKGRRVPKTNLKGEAHYKWKHFTPEQLTHVHTSHQTQDQLAEMYGVSQALISLIKTGKSPCRPRPTP